MIFFQIAMSSQLTSLVPVLDGTNYNQWAAAMQSFLMSQGQWWCTKPGFEPPVFEKIEATKHSPATSNAAEVEEWETDSEKVLGNIRLRLHHTIGYQYNDIEVPHDLWKDLKEKYGQPGMSRAFAEFKGVMDTVIPNGSDPSPSLDKIMAHFTRLKEMKRDIPEKVQAMIIMTKAPSSMESIVQMITLASKDDEDKMTTERVVKSMRLSWETHNHSGRGPQGQNHRNNHSKPKSLARLNRQANPPSSSSSRTICSVNQTGSREGADAVTKEKEVEERMHSISYSSHHSR